MKYYLTKNNRIITDTDLKQAAYLVYGKHLETDSDELDLFAHACAGVSCEVDPECVTVEFLVDHGEYARATRMYYDTHKGTLKEAYAYINAIRDKKGVVM